MSTDLAKPMGQAEANEDFFQRSRKEWAEMGGFPKPNPTTERRKPARESLHALNGVTAVTDVAQAPAANAQAASVSPLIDGGVVLGEVHDFLAEFVVYPSIHAQVAHALWVAHAHLMDSWDSTPRLAFLSPEPGSWY